jgi:glycosyltransferase involved in cell wall biosynthesis
MITKHLYPLISCICITDSRPELLLKAIISFDGQNYPNRELIVSIPKEDTVSKNLIQNIIELSSMNISMTERSKETTIGEARNQAINACHGTYFCLWDDDDWYRDARLMFQYTILRSMKQKREACILTTVLLYDRKNDKAYYSAQHPFPGSLLCKTEYAMKYPFAHSNLNEGEELINYLTKAKLLHQFQDY